MPPHFRFIVVFAQLGRAVEGYIHSMARPRFGEACSLNSREQGVAD